MLLALCSRKLIREILPKASAHERVVLAAPGSQRLFLSLRTPEGREREKLRFSWLKMSANTPVLLTRADADGVGPEGLGQTTSAERMRETVIRA